MKKIYFVLILSCLGFIAQAQPTTVTINATGASGSYKTGYVNNISTPTRNDGDIQAHASSSAPTNNKRGWAVFNLPAIIPPASVVTGVKLRFTINSVANAENATTVGIFGFAGDMSTVTSAATVFANCDGTGTNFCTTQWGGAPATDTLTLNASGVSFINTNAGSKVSMGWECNSNIGQTYTITGETGTATTQPQLMITYTCVGVSGVTATASPNPVCQGSTLTLTGTGTGTTTYSWAGPGGYTSTTESPTLTASLGSAGVYTFSATSAAGCSTIVTTTVAVNPLPASITGVKSACKTLTTILSDATPGGVWSSAISSTATINPTTGLLNGTNAGVVQITYTLPTGCFVSVPVTVTPPPPPSPITGINVVCVGQTTTLSQATGVGYWTSDSVALATVDPVTGVVTGVAMGTPVITYTIGIACTTTRSVTVHPRAAITGADSICKGATTYLANIVDTGTWQSDFPGIASIDTFSGFLTGVNGGIANITYTTLQGCVTVRAMNIIPLPPPITGVLRTCPGDFTTLSDAVSGGAWSSANVGVATTTSTGRVYGVFPDTVTIFYTLPPGCATSTTVLVNPLPAPITGRQSLCVTTYDTLYDVTPGGIWSSVTPTLASIIDTSGIVHGLAGGNAIIWYTSPVTGCKARDTLVVHPLPTPVIVYNHSTATMSVDTYYASYQWYNDLEGLIPGATSPSIAGLYTENYWVVVTDTFGCVNTSAHYFFDATLLGVNVVVDPYIKIYPNPANSTLYIQYGPKVKAVISGIDGKAVLVQDDAKEIDISHLADGMYFITLYNDKQPLTTRKFVKQ